LNREVGILNSLFIYTLQEKTESIPNLPKRIIFVPTDQTYWRRGNHSTLAAHAHMG